MTTDNKSEGNDRGKCPCSPVTSYGLSLIPTAFLVLPILFNNKLLDYELEISIA